jgi:hypothetical protein
MKLLPQGKELAMNTVDFTGVTPPLFLLNIIFVLLIFSLFSMAVLRFFQGRPKSGVMYVLLGILAVIVFAVILNIYFIE